MITRLALIVLVFLLPTAASARDLDGRYAGSPLSPWFKSQKDKFGTSCCADADGVTIKDIDWSAQGEGQECQHTPALSYQNETSSYDGQYCVRYKNEWWLVPQSALIEEPNRFGPAIIWPVCSSKHYVSGADACKDEESTLLFMRCFIPGAGS